MSTLKTSGGLAIIALAALAVPVCPAASNVPGVPRFYQVNERVFRGGQPTAEAWPHLAKLGVKTVIDLRRVDEHDTQEEAKAVTAAGMKYINLPMKGVVAPSDDKVIRILRLLDSNEPVFIHCKRGADRTGAMVACYRIAREGWESDRALDEAKTIGMSWTQIGLKSYVKKFQPSMMGVALDTSAEKTTVEK